MVQGGTRERHHGMCILACARVVLLPQVLLVALLTESVRQVSQRVQCLVIGVIFYMFPA
jgi:hypothetical protein